MAKLLNRNLAQGYYVKPGDRVIPFSQGPAVLADVVWRDPSLLANPDRFKAPLLNVD
jgi:hypothetical protein